MKESFVTNPILWADVPDPSVIRVDDIYYMVSTSMHSMPGCPIMKSKNLKDWEIINYVFQTLEDNDAHNLMNGQHIYGKGSWAVSLRYHQKTFYVCFSSNDMQQFYIYTTKNLEAGDWNRVVFDGLYHDPSLLFDNDRLFVIYGNGDIRITELTPEATKVKENGIHRLLLSTASKNIRLRCEGCHAYKRNGYYYLFFIEWPADGNQRRRQICYRSKDLLGPYEMRVVLDDDMGYHNKGIAQGGIVDTKEGRWFALLFQDHDAVGRIPHLVPVSWEDDWPIFGTCGKVPSEFISPLPETQQAPLVLSDEFQYETNKLALNWQWNHNPNNELWSLTERKGYLRLRTGHITKSVEFARNTLTQRTEGPRCTAITKLDFKQMKPGDRAGLVALQSHYAWIGVLAGNEQDFYIGIGEKGDLGEEDITASTLYTSDTVYLKASFDFENSKDFVEFSYSNDGITWEMIGQKIKLHYTLDHFMGCRVGLFNYATQNINGMVDFDFFHYKKR
ncbi:glycoside hydrolase family 43 protein [Gracilibacillus dipsosauri]|uniref:glycoside hydrolase family 43 protein n=1 Tax=Gracilibacillus dipsosauri TaxID=178340 RepID=UPI00240A89A8